MKTRTSLTFLASALFLSSGTALASGGFTDPLDGMFDMSDFLSENAYGFLPVPVIITEPSVESGLGMVGLFFHETEEEKAQRKKAMQSADRDAQKYLIPPSVSAAFGAYTGNGSWMAGGGHMGFFNEGKTRYMGGGGYGDINIDYYGTGDVALPRPIDLNTQAAMVMQNVKFELADSQFFAGVSQRYINADISLNSLGALEDYLPPELTGQIKEYLSQDVVTSALGLVAMYDNRDNVFSPYEGYHYDVGYHWYRDEIGSDVEYDLATIEGRNYWMLSEQWLLGARVHSEYANSDAFLPPFATPFIDLRGIPVARYQGLLVGALEAELTWRLDKRWNIKAFTGAGRASNSGADFSKAKTHQTYGAGFRYQVARRYGFDAGVDVAKGPEDWVFYITAGSAW